jgi:hypothetical protein
MNDFQLDRGSIWEIVYIVDCPTVIDPLEEENMVDRQTRAISQDTFSPPPGLTPDEYSLMFMNHFMKTRTKSREIVNEMNKRAIRYSTLAQLGNQECLNDIYTIQSSEGFIRWENKNLVDYFVSLSKEYLNG